MRATSSITYGCPTSDKVLELNGLKKDVFATLIRHVIHQNYSEDAPRQIPKLDEGSALSSIHVSEHV